MGRGAGGGVVALVLHGWPYCVGGHAARVAILRGAPGGAAVALGQRGERAALRAADLFLTTFRRAPTANAEGLDRVGGLASERFRAGRVFRYPQIGTHISYGNILVMATY